MSSYWNSIYFALAETTPLIPPPFYPFIERSSTFFDRQIQRWLARDDVRERVQTVRERRETARNWESTLHKFVTAYLTGNKVAWLSALLISNTGIKLCECVNHCGYGFTLRQNINENNFVFFFKLRIESWFKRAFWALYITPMKLLSSLSTFHLFKPQKMDKLTVSTRWLTSPRPAPERDARAVGPGTAWTIAGRDYGRIFDWFSKIFVISSNHHQTVNCNPIYSRVGVVVSQILV